MSARCGINVPSSDYLPLDAQVSLQAVMCTVYWTQLSFDQEKFPWKLRPVSVMIYRLISNKKKIIGWFLVTKRVRKKGTGNWKFVG